MPDMFQFVEDAPIQAIGYPGVYANNSGRGFRVPYNTFDLLGWKLPYVHTAEFGEKVLRTTLKSPLLWEGVEKLIKPHQERALIRSFGRAGSMIKSPTGSGKTLMGITFAAAYTPGPRIVITAAGIRTTWWEEIAKWSNMTPIMLLGTSPPTTREATDSLKEDWPSAFYICAWETIIPWREWILKQLRPTTVVMDEVQMVKNRIRSKKVMLPDGTEDWKDLDNQARAAREIAGSAQQRLTLTATPIPNVIMDMWGQLDLTEPFMWGGSRTWGTRYAGGKPSPHGDWLDYEKKPTEVEELRSRLRYTMISIGRQEVAKYMPPKRRIVTAIPPELQDKADTGFKVDIKRFGRAAQSGDKDAQDGLFETMIMEAASRKRTVVCDKVESAVRSGLKVTVFTGRRQDAIALGDEIKKRVAKLGAPVWVSSGEDSTVARDKIRHEYMAYKPVASIRGEIGCVNVATGYAWGRGLNLQDTDYVAMVMLPWTPELLQQWEGRFPRMGGERAVLIEYFYCVGTADELVKASVLDKLPAQVEILDEVEFADMIKDFAPPIIGDILSRVRVCFE